MSGGIELISATTFEVDEAGRQRPTSRQPCLITKDIANGFLLCQRRRGHRGLHCYDWWLPHFLRMRGWWRIANFFPPWPSLRSPRRG